MCKLCLDRAWGVDQDCRWYYSRSSCQSFYLNIYLVPNHCGAYKHNSGHKLVIACRIFSFDLGKNLGNTNISRISKYL